MSKHLGVCEIPWLYTTWDQMVASNVIQCFISDDNNHDTSLTVYQVQTMVVDFSVFSQPFPPIPNLFQPLAD